MDIPINYWAILACGVANMVVGFVWYGPLFGKPWSKLMGWGAMTKEEVKAKQKKAGPAYAISFVAALVMAYTLAHALAFGNAYLGTSGISGGLQGAFWYWLGFITTVTLGTVLWDGKPWKLYFINVGYWLVSLGVMATILSLWV